MSYEPDSWSHRFALSRYALYGSLAGSALCGLSTPVNWAPSSLP